MVTVTSVSGGRTSAYLAAQYPSDHLVFSLVRVSDPECIFPDPALRQKVSDKIGKEFIGTVEDDIIINTIFDLEQFTGKAINWVTGDTYENVIKKSGGWLPNALHRFCTTELKLKPIFDWWRVHINEPVIMQIGYRANETKRANKMLSRLNPNGLLEFNTIVGKFGTKNKRGFVEWQRPSFPLIEDNIYKVDIVNFWKNKPVTFAEYNNCVGCFHRNPYFLKYMYTQHPAKMRWFAKQENGRKRGTWKAGVRYENIDKMCSQAGLFTEQFSDCDDGFCEID